MGRTSFLSLFASTQYQPVWIAFFRSSLFLYFQFFCFFSPQFLYTKVSEWFQCKRNIPYGNLWKSNWNVCPVNMQNRKDSPNYASHYHSCVLVRRFQWPRRLRRGSAAARFLGLQVKSRRGNGCLLWVLCVIRQRSATDRSFVQRSTTECVCVTECDQWIGKDVRLRKKENK